MSQKAKIYCEVWISYQLYKAIWIQYSKGGDKWKISFNPNERKRDKWKISFNLIWKEVVLEKQKVSSEKIT